jgi:hypothetical protein
MLLIQILLPLESGPGRPFPREHYEAVRRELTERYHGFTSYHRAPADGFWGRGAGAQRDALVLCEVMVDALEREWWAEYRALLERRFAQESIVIRALDAQRL